MLTIHRGGATRNCEGLTRRDLLQVGTLGLGGLSLSHLLQLQGVAGTGRNPIVRDRAIVMLNLQGGPTHIETFDPKMTAPAEYRAMFGEVSTTLPGVTFGSHFERLARHAHRMSIVRSLGYNNGDHPFMTYYTLTGRISPRPLGANTVLPPSRDDDPHMGCVVSKFQHRVPQVPGYVAIPEVQVRMTMMPVAGGGRAGYLRKTGKAIAFSA